MNDQVARNTRQERLARVSDISKLTTAGRDQAFGVRIAGPRFAAMKGHPGLGSRDVGGSVSGEGGVDVEGTCHRVPWVVKAGHEAVVIRCEGSRPSMTTDGIVKERVELLRNGSRVWIQRPRADRASGRGGQHDRDTCGNAHLPFTRGEAR
jgi:hypothetical protein